MPCDSMLLIGEILSKICPPSLCGDLFGTYTAWLLMKRLSYLAKKFHNDGIWTSTWVFNCGMLRPSFSQCDWCVYYNCSLLAVVSAIMSLIFEYLNDHYSLGRTPKGLHLTSFNWVVPCVNRVARIISFTSI